MEVRLRLIVRVGWPFGGSFGREFGIGEPKTIDEADHTRKRKSRGCRKMNRSYDREKAGRPDALSDFAAGRVRQKNPEGDGGEGIFGRLVLSKQSSG
jgi:hypothetical protein